MCEPSGKSQGLATASSVGYFSGLFRMQFREPLHLTKARLSFKPYPGCRHPRCHRNRKLLPKQHAEPRLGH